MAPFLGILFVLGMAVYGLKSGAVPALRMFLVSAASFMLAYTLKEPLYPILRSFLGKVDPAWVEAFAYLIPQILIFGVLLGTMMKHSRETVPTNKLFDQLGGAAIGVAAGITMAGFILVSIMILPGGEKHVGSVDLWFLGPHHYVLRTYEYFSRHIPGERRFDAGFAIADLEHGRPEMPIGKSGLWAVSAPLGLRVYINPGHGREEDVLDYKRELETMLRKSQQPIRWETPTPRRRQRKGYLGQTSTFGPVDSTSMLVAVEKPLPEDASASTEESPYLWDGEVAWWIQEARGGEKVFVKVYQVQRSQDELSTIIATFIPRGEKGPARYERDIPTRDCYGHLFEESEARQKLGPTADADRYVDWLKRAGKAVFVEPSGQLRVLQVTSQKTIAEETKPADHQAQNMN